MEAGTFHVIKDGVVYEIEHEPEGGFSVSVPDLPGCLTYGDTFEQAMELVADAIQGWVAVARRRGLPIPPRFDELQRAS